MKHGKADFSASGFILSKERSQAVDYLPPLMQSYQQFFIRNPAEQYDFEAYILPMKWRAWIVGIVFSLLLPLLLVIAMFERK